MSRNTPEMMFVHFQMSQPLAFVNVTRLSVQLIIAVPYDSISLIIYHAQGEHSLFAESTPLLEDLRAGTVCLCNCIIKTVE